jgi:peptide/nickel transport system substrate-binding protein
MESTTAYDQLAKGSLVMLLYDWIGDYPDPDNFLSPLLGCEQSRANRCLKGNSALSGSFWTEPGLQQALIRSTELEGQPRVALLQTIQRRVAAASPYLPVWLMAPVAWSGPGVSRPSYDGSGRVQLGDLQQERKPEPARPREARR